MIKLLAKHQLTLRESTHADILPIAFNMREDDRQEVWASNLFTPEEALTTGFKYSTICRTALRGKTPIAMYGVVAVPERPGMACVWMLGTDELFKIRTCFGRTSRDIMDSLLAVYPLLYNYVDVRNKKSIAWLKRCGAQFGEPAPYGVGKMPFVFFQLRKGI